MLRKKYNMSIIEYDRMYKSQDYSCKICLRDVNYNLHVDHCHTTGKVRGLLCSKCNKGLGSFEDNIDSLKAAIDYLDG